MDAQHVADTEGDTMTAKSTADESFSAQERAAMKERAAEIRAESKRAKGAEKAAADEKDVLEKIAQMPDGDREMAERVHTIVTTVAPGRRKEP